jgi:hypothetical protein
MGIPNSELAAWAKAAVKAKGATEAARRLGLDREVLLAIAAEARVRDGTLALVEQRFRERSPEQLGEDGDSPDPTPPGAA